MQEELLKQVIKEILREFMNGGTLGVEGLLGEKTGLEGGSKCEWRGWMRGEEARGRKGMMV